MFGPSQRGSDTLELQHVEVVVGGHGAPCSETSDEEQSVSQAGMVNEADPGPLYG